ncbi:MAG: hypothetical protein ACJ8DI_11760 [Ktedonobacteraceae bacterium]
MFAQTISRLCSVLTLGRHVCDVGVLFPTTTVQAGLRLDGFNQDAQAAHDLYLRLVGKMHWFKVEPGVLDRACRDFDVLDDASIQRGEVRNGRLHIGEECYRAIVLPGCSVLEDDTAARLIAFVEGGGTLVAVGRFPRMVVGTTGGGERIQQLTALFELGQAHRVNAPEEVLPRLSTVPAQIEAPVPTLVRLLPVSQTGCGQAMLVFVPAISPRATRMRSEREPKAEVDQDAWLNVDYTFDPSTYHRVITVRVRGIQDAPELWEPSSGRKHALEAHLIDGGLEVHVPFDDSPGVLLVWPGEQEAERSLERSGRFTAPTADLSASERRKVLPDTWKVDIAPTLDNRWGDFALPAITSSIGVERWEFRHMVDASGQAGLKEHWFNPDWDDSNWPLVHATFGPHGIWTGPIEPERLPAPLGTEDEWGSWRNSVGEWREAIYSLSRGIYKDRLHRTTLGPKGHVPEEFLDFGCVRAGEAVQFRTTLVLTEPLTAYLALGAPAQKTLWVNGTRAITYPPDRVGTVLSLVPDVPDEHGRIEWLRFVVPPGAVRMHLKLHGGATVYLDGVEQQPVAYVGVTVMEVNLSQPTALRRVCTLRVETRPGYRAGGILDAPVGFEMATGVMKVGSWEEQGLVGYSGGVRYGQTLVRGGQAELLHAHCLIWDGCAERQRSISTRNSSGYASGRRMSST